MAWTGWVFEMKDGRLFSYGSGFNMEFLDLPNGYTFEDVIKVHNHSFVLDGALRTLEEGRVLPSDYDRVNLLRERQFFTCYIDGI